MTTQEQINELESQQLELQGKMAATDAHAAKCIKLGKKFSTVYPSEYVDYMDFNAQYNENETKLAALRAQLTSEEEEFVPVEEA